MRFRCRVCAGPPKGLEFEDNAGRCPKCGRDQPPQVIRLCDVHFVVLHPEGPIWGERGRQFIACQPKREHMALSHLDEFHASDMPHAVTCPRCKTTSEFREILKLFPDLQMQFEQEQVVRKVVSQVNP